MIRALVVPESLSHTASWWRSWGPLAQMSREYENFTPIALDAVDWTVMRFCSLAFIQAPHHFKMWQIANMARSHKVPVVIDVDDDVWDMPRGNPGRVALTRDMIDWATKGVQMADAVTVSTVALYERVRSLGAKRVELIPNALPEFVTWHDRPCSKVVWWRGSEWHRHNIRSVASELLHEINRNPDWHWIFAGTDPDEITTQITHDNFSVRPTIDIFMYHEHLAQAAPAILINPLLDHPFNYAKSNIGWMEAAMAGGAILAPDFPEYRQPGAVTYKPGEFGSKLSDMLKGARPDRALARTEIDANWRLRPMNVKRMELFKSLL